MNAFFVRAAALLAAIGVAPAQQVWPAAYTNTPGNAVLNAPFTLGSGQATDKTRCMVILDGASLPFGPGTTLTRLAFRRDSSYGTAYPSVSGSLRVRLAHAVVGPDAVHDVRFSRLWDGNSTTVFDSAVSGAFVVPAAPAPGAGVPGFTVVVTFTRNFVYQGGPLAIDLVFAPAPGSAPWRVDGFANPVARGGTFRTLGEGCTGSNGFRAFHYPLPETTVPGAVLTLQMEGSVRPTTQGTLHDLALHVIGLSGTMTGTVPLPIDLGPILGTPNGCMLRVDPLLTTTVPISNPSLLFGRATAQVPLPNSPSAVGAQLYSQWLCFDLGVGTTFPATLSDGIEITIGASPPPPSPRLARTIWRYGATGFDNESGRTVPEGYGPIIRFN